MITLSPRTSYDHDPFCWPPDCPDCGNSDSRDATATQLHCGSVSDPDWAARAILSPWASPDLISILRPLFDLRGTGRAEPGYFSAAKKRGFWRLLLGALFANVVQESRRLSFAGRLVPLRRRARRKARHAHAAALQPV